jgi:hypothetical protein
MHIRILLLNPQSPGDINTGHCYRRTYKELVKKKGVEIILPTVVAMDKTQVDTYGRMQI